MKNVIVRLLLLCLFGNPLSAQMIKQQPLIAAGQISESIIYRYLVENGKPTGDSILAGHSWYNALGYSMVDMNFDSLRYFDYKTVNEYRDDSILSEATFFDKGDVKIRESTYLYDAAGNNIKNIGYYPSHRESLPETLVYVMVYDSLNRKVESYNDEGKGKMYVAHYEYNSRGNMVKRSNDNFNQTSIYINGFEYDDRNNVIRFYDLTGGKKKLVQENTFNNLNQWVEKRYFGSRKVKKQFFNQRYTAKKKTVELVRYYYDARGLLRREERYFNATLKGILVYRYMPRS